MKKLKNTNKGITLIALVVTVIVMLILVAVTISMAINGGLFDYAGKGVADTQNAIYKEQELANGKVKIGDTIYNSIDEYLNTPEKIDELKITYSIKDIDKGSKAVALRYYRPNRIVLTEQIETKIEEAYELEITDDIRNEMSTEAETLGISFDEYLLEILLNQGPLTSDTRSEAKAEATKKELTYKEYLVELSEDIFIYFLLTSKDIEAKIEEINNITITDEMRNNWKDIATEQNIKYEICLLETLTHGVALDEETRLGLKESIKNLRNGL